MSRSPVRIGSLAPVYFPTLLKYGGDFFIIEPQDHAESYVKQEDKNKKDESLKIFLKTLDKDSKIVYTV